jgi:hypothetical protein
MIHNQRIADLSLEQRTALEAALLGKRVPAQKQPAIPRLVGPDAIPDVRRLSGRVTRAVGERVFFRNQQE